MAILLDCVGGVSFSTDTVGWIRTPYGICISENPSKAFTSLIQHLESVVSKDKDNDTKSVDEWLGILKDNNLKSPYGNSDGSNLINGASVYAAPNYTDTRVGGNDAINPYWQFNRDDDITPPMFLIGGKDNNGRRGMGRVYGETYEANQSILWLQMGVPEFSSLTDLFLFSGNSDAAKAMNQGSLIGLGTKIMTLIVRGSLWLITFPITAPLFAIKWIARLSANEITKFYHFRPAMPLYYDMVNTMLSYLAVSMGIYPAYLVRRTNSTIKSEFANMSEGGNGVENYADTTLQGASEKQFKDSALPEILQSAPDIYKILNRRRRNYMNMEREYTTRDLLMATATAEGSVGVPMRSPDSPIQTTELYDMDGNPRTFPNPNSPDDPSTNIAGRYFSFLKSSILGAFDFVGFKCEKGAVPTESISNSTAASPLFENLNNFSRQRLLQMNEQNILNRGVIGWLSGESADSFIKTELKMLAANVISALTGTSAGAIITNGNGYFDVPEMWSGSSFDRGVSFNIQLRARYGDPVSIYQSIYIPLMLLIAASCPRAIGDNMYTAPFIVKAYCKGKFSISCGMVTSLSITRGKDSFGWSDSELPTAVDVQLNIKDMSPAMFLAMQDIGLFDTFTRNESMMDYLDTLSALGIYERMYDYPRMMRKLTAAVLVKKNTIFSPEWWAFKTAKTRAGMAFSALTPWRPVHEKSDYEVRSQE